MSTFSWTSHGVLVTGSDGFLGPWLVEAAAARGARVFALVRPDSSTRHLNLPRIAACGAQAVTGDVCDLPLLSQLLDEHGIGTVIHLAAINANVGSAVSPYEVFRTNMHGTVTVLEACRMAGTPRVVVASSREAEDCFVPESIRKVHPYMASKAAAELASRAYAETYGLAAVVMRSDNIYGGGDFNWNRLVPATIRSALDERRPVIRGNGMAARDYVYVEDAAEAYIAAAERADQPAVKGGLFRIASGRPVTTLGIVQAILIAANAAKLEPLILNEPVEERIHTPYDPVLERDSLGWSARTPLHDGLARTVAAYRRHNAAPST